MSNFPSISVIIPSNHSHGDLFKVVQSICHQTVRPTEILIIDSSVEAGVCSAEIWSLCAVNSIKLIYEHRELALPGDARNIGLGMANGELIAFIDVQTIPRQHWLEASLAQVSSNDIAGAWGATCFSAESRFERLVRDSFYGMLPRRTLPGSVFKRRVFDKAGQFIDWVRAGEDTEWILRLEALKIPVVRPLDALLDYVGLIGFDTTLILKKWYRNYTASKDLPHFFPQKLLIWLFIYPLLVLVAFNWNYLIADWRMDSPLYIGHVTKIVAFLPGLAYLLLRGILLPLQRGVAIWGLLPIRFLEITSICILADGVKILVFSLPKFMYPASKPKLGK
jgi:hypothetical protein